MHRNDTLNIIQISDMHLFAEDNQHLLGVNTKASFQAVLDLLRSKKEKMDLILLSGDISQDGTAASYRLAATLLKPFAVPVYCVPGNHDNVTVMQQVFPYETISLERHILLKNWQIILLNSQIPGKVAGQLAPSELNFLADCLQKYPDHRAMIVFHHQPLKIQSAWLDKIGMHNAEDFWALVGQYKNVNLVLYGHIHQVLEQVIQGIPCLSTPATCVQFKGQQDAFGLEHLPPGYRWIQVAADGEIKTGVERLPAYIGRFDADAKGY